MTNEELLEDGGRVEVHDEVGVWSGYGDIPLLPRHLGEPNQPNIFSEFTF